MTLEEYVKENKKTHIIFDFDETIVKLLLPWDHAMDRIKKDLENLDPKTIGNYRNNKVSYSTMQNLYVEKHGEKALELILKNNSAFETKDLKGYLKNDRVINFIKKSTENLFIWSSNSKKVIQKILEEEKITNKFQKIVSRDDVNFLKPNADGFKFIYDTKTIKKNYLLIGDSSSDENAAKNVGIDFFLEDYFNTPDKYW